MVGNTLTAAEVLEREFLNIRAKILEVGALLDRLDRAEGELADPRRERIDRAIAVLQQSESTRAEQIQLIFSLPFADDWQQKFEAEGWRRTRPAK